MTQGIRFLSQGIMLTRAIWIRVQYSTCRQLSVLSVAMVSKVRERVLERRSKLGTGTPPLENATKSCQTSIGQLRRSYFSPWID